MAVANGEAPKFLFVPNEEFATIGIRIDQFPLEELVHLIGLPIPVSSIDTDPLTEEKVSVKVRVIDVAESVREFGDNPKKADFWKGLAFGLKSNP